MAHPLDGARLKVERSWQHLEQFHAETRAFLETHPYSFTISPADGDDGWVEVHAHVRRQIPDHLALVFGDAVHNLRSALDHLAYQLALLGTGPSGRTQWPIFDDPAKFADYGKPYLSGIVEPQRARVIQLQPFNDLDGLGWLTLLHEADIADKHHRLGLVFAAPREAEVTMSGGRVIKVRNPERPVHVKDGAAIMRFRLPNAAETPDVHMEAQLGYRLFVGDPKRALAADAILMWSYAVLEILDSFAPDFV